METPPHAARSDAGHDAPTLDAFVAELERLGPSELLMLAAAPPPDAANHLAAARVRAREAAREAHLEGELDRLRTAIVAWSGAEGALSGVYAPVSRPSDLLLADLRAQAVPVILDAALAVVLGEGIDPSTRAALLAGWERVDSGGDTNGER